MHQSELFDTQSPFGEARCYHNSSGQGYFSLLTDTGATKRQESHPLSKMPVVLDGLDGRLDTWLSQAEFFRPCRRVVNLARIGLLFADIDTYRRPWSQGRSPEQMVSSVLYFCNEEGLPPPSLIVYSGRGLQAKWLLEHAVPRQALPRWNACQKSLISALAPLGADPAAKDASRVLRLVTSVNSKSGEICRVVHIEPGEDGDPVRYPFEYLAEHLLPIARDEFVSEKKRARAKLTVINGATAPRRRLSGRQLAWDRLNDLRSIMTMRGGAAEGERMLYLFWQLNFLLLSGATHSTRMYHEAATLANQIDAQWSYKSQELSTLYHKAQAFNKGAKVVFNGKRYPALYTPTNSTLISTFEITDAEQGKLKTIISREMARERDRLRSEARRRKAGAVPRREYEEKSIARQKPWVAQGVSRATYYRSIKPAHPGP